MKNHILDPLSDTLLPLTFGITRHTLLRLGVAEEDRHLAGIPIHFFTQAGRPGSNPQRPIVLVHGIADNALTWAFIMYGLARIGPVYALDLPGFGLSGYPQGRRYASIDEHVAVVRALITDVIGRPALLIGNSLGAWINARLTLAHPEIAQGLVMLDPGGAMLDGRPSWEPFVEVVAVPDLRTVRRVIHQMFGWTPLLPAIYLGQRGFQTLFRRDPVTHFVAAASEDDFFSPSDLAHIQVPSALIWGNADQFLPSGSFEFFRDNLPNPSLLTLPGCGHLPQRERPRAVIRFVRRFVAERLAPLA